MKNKEKIKVLVVDDSALFRKLLSRGISIDTNIDVVATAVDPYDASDKIIEHKPDVVILDVVMPKMSGLEFLRGLMSQNPLPVIVISSVSEYVFDALRAGAVDFMGKPNIRAGENFQDFLNELIRKIKIASTANLSHMTKRASKVVSEIKPKWENRLIAIGASTGGTEATSTILKSLPENAPGIVIVQHMPPGFTQMYAQRLDSSVALNVKEAQTGDIVKQGSVFIAPGDYHMKVEKVRGNYKITCLKGEKVNGHCPSVDVLFESVAQEVGKDAIGVILTGMGRDGAKGLLAMRKWGKYNLPR